MVRSTRGSCPLDPKSGIGKRPRSSWHAVGAPIRLVEGLVQVRARPGTAAMRQRDGAPRPDHPSRSPWGVTRTRARAGSPGDWLVGERAMSAVMNLRTEQSKVNMAKRATSLAPLGGEELLKRIAEELGE